MATTNNAAELIIVGGGLSGLLTAWFRLLAHPHETVLVLEAAERAGGDHTWSFNLTDIDPPLLTRMQPFIAHQWPRYDVRFPNYTRTLEIAYASGNTASLLQAVAPLVDAGRLVMQTNTRVEAVLPQAVQLHDGRRLTAKAVIDARGGAPGPHTQLAYQKFVGQTVRTAAPHGLTHPLLMDASVDQLDGYRFVYCLPFSATELLIEDTCYDDGPELQDAAFAARIADYARAQGWQVAEVLRTERGVLPITLACNLEAGLQAEPVPRIGLAGGVFHATTGYSLPDAVRLAERIARTADLDDRALRLVVHNYRREHWRREAFYRRLNRMLICAAKPGQRYRVLQRFYGFQEGLIRRFYAGQLSRTDQARILMGKPPVPLLAAAAVMSEARFIQSHKRSHYAAKH